jgi:two-component system, sensor histidine kinase RpfC
MSDALRERLRALRARLQGRADSEHEQALIRLAVGAVFFLYLLPEAFQGGLDAGSLEKSLFLPMLGFMVLAAGIFAAIAISPGMSPARRVFGAVVDSAATSYFMAQTGVNGLPLYVVYLWIIVGNGFRYGKFYLLNTLALSGIGFSVVLYTSSFWQTHLGAGIGLLLTMVALSVYVLSLVRRLNDALHRAEAANLAKRRFVSTVSHEMRTPLNAIIGMLELLRDTPLNVEQSGMVKTIGQSSRAMLGLIEDVLDFSKIEAGKLTIARERFDLYALVNGVMQMLRPQAEGKGLSFASTLMPDVPPDVRGDEAHLRQVLINLLANAVKFTARGGVTLHVSRVGDGPQSVVLKFSIRDTGIGIAPEDQRRIFESFTQADQTTTRRFGGTGLGTTIAKQLAELMGGRLGLESAVGLGSTFWFELPLEVEATEFRAEEPAALVQTQVLAIRLPAEPLAQIESMLRGWGGACVRAAGLEDAVAHVVAAAERQGQMPTCGLLYAEDLESAERDVMRLRRQLGGKRLPIVLCAPEASNVHRIPIVHGGYAAVLALPADKRMLFNTLHAFTATDQAEGVVFISDYLKRRDAGRSLRVLVADDNAVNQTVLAKILERANHELTLVAHGDEALDTLERERFDIAIFDRNMPGMSGIEAVRALRMMEMGGPQLPVIVLSADVTEEARREAAEAGADLYLTKPVQATRLLEALITLCPSAEPAAAPVAGRAAAEAPGTEPPDAAMLDYDQLTLLEGLGSRSDFMERLVGVFIGDSAALMDKMDGALDAKRFGELRSLVHALKGSAGSIGADQLARTCTELQDLAEGDLRLRGKTHLGRLRSDLDRTRGELTDYLRKRKSSTG